MRGRCFHASPSSALAFLAADVTAGSCHCLALKRASAMVVLCRFPVGGMKVSVQRSARAESDNRHVDTRTADTVAKPLVIGDLKLFEPKTMCPIIAVRDREER